MMLVLKLPIVYLAAVCWWAIRAQPRPLEGAARPVEPEPGGGPRRSFRRAGPRPRRGSPHGSPVRGGLRQRRAFAAARAARAERR